MANRKQQYGVTSHRVMIRKRFSFQILFLVESAKFDKGLFENDAPFQEKTSRDLRQLKGNTNGKPHAARFSYFDRAAGSNYLVLMKSCRLLLPIDMQVAAEQLCAALQAEVTVVDTAPVWREENRRLFQIDLPDFHYRLLEELGRTKGASPETLLHEWIAEYASEKQNAKADRVLGRCRLMVKWLNLGFAGKEADLRHLALRLARL
jgi:hypothetical protein